MSLPLPARPYAPVRYSGRRCSGGLRPARPSVLGRAARRSCEPPGGRWLRANTGHPGDKRGMSGVYSGVVRASFRSAADRGRGSLDCPQRQSLKSHNQGCP
ncbi:hypothetical protein GCM10009716_29490 [Streptomyces sodiiphilus]|uniref:Uncharacterized protein n=1 Tax=Streptomyces sodiiphilus TaxID=226217 RepID=A0ABN2PD70_9ACTN